MNIRDIPVPDIYKSSSDFRFFMRWFESALSQLKYDTDNFLDLYDPLRCKSELLWLLAWTMGFKYDDRDGLNVAYNRLVLLYFMSMIRLKGSKDGVTLAAEVNLAQFNVLDRANKGYTDVDGNFVPPNDILNERLEDTAIPVNSVYVTPHTREGYIDVVYFSTDIPIDACIEYVRPLGMYIFPYAGVRYDARTKIAVDARLTNTNDLGVSIGPTHVGHYRREDYARLQKIKPDEISSVKQGLTDVMTHKRYNVYYRNSAFEGQPDPDINPGYRALYSLQLCNNENVFQSLIRDENIQRIFNVGYKPSDFAGEPTAIPDVSSDDKPWNLLYHQRDSQEIAENPSKDVYTVEPDRSDASGNVPRPAVNPVMGVVGEAIDVPVWNAQTQQWEPSKNRQYTIYDADQDKLVIKPAEDIDS